MKTCYVFWICVLSFTQGDVSIFFYDKNVDMLPGNPTVKIIEFDNLLLNCSSVYGETSFSWTKDDSFLSSNPILKIERITVIDAGQYMCEAIRFNNTTSKTVSDKKSVDVDVLYAPSAISVKVPPSVLWPEEITLSASVRANPEPTYEWRRDGTLDTILSRNKTYHFTPNENLNIYCIVQNRLIPTLGDFKIGRVVQPLTIVLHVKAVIRSINYGLYTWVTQGQKLELICNTGGYPEPTVWWTKTGDESFLSEGNRYFVLATNESHAGKYICHAENTVRSANQSTLTTKVSAEFQLFIRVDSKSTINPSKASCSPDDCKGVCSTTESTIRSKVEQCTCTSPTSPTHNGKSDFRNEPTFIGLLFALCLFIVAFMVSVSLNIYSYVLRRKLKPENNIRNYSPRTGSSTTMTTRSSEPGPMPHVTTPDHHYTDLTHYDQIYSSSTRCDEEDQDRFAFIARQPSVNSYLNPVNSSQFS